MSKRLTFVTGNANKLEEVKRILGSALGQWEIVSQSVDLMEIQAASNREVTISKCEEAYRQVQGPVIVEDTGLHFDAMDDLPGALALVSSFPVPQYNNDKSSTGPYIKWFLEKLKPEGLHKMLIGFDNFATSASCTVALKVAADSQPILFEGRVPGTLVVPRGPRTFGWDCCFQPDGHQQTYAEMEKAFKNSISHRYKAFALLKQHLEAELLS